MIETKQSKFFPSDHIINELSSLEEKLKLKKINYDQLKERLGSMKIKGFNYNAFAFGIIAFHTFNLYRTKTLLYELEGKAPRYMMAALGVGVALGFLVGYGFSYNLCVYRKYRSLESKLN